MSDNIVTLPGTSKEIVTPTGAPARPQEQLDPQKFLENVNVQRKSSLQRLKDKLSSLFDRENEVHPKDTVAESTLRDVTRSLESTLSVLEALNQLVDVLVNDLVSVGQGMTQGQNLSITTYNQLHTLLALLREKGVFKDEELKEKWEALVKEEQEKSDTTPQE